MGPDGEDSPIMGILSCLPDSVLPSSSVSRGNQREIIWQVSETNADFQIILRHHNNIHIL